MTMTVNRPAAAFGLIALCIIVGHAPGAEADAGDGASRWEARQRQSMDKVIARTDRARTIWGLEHQPNGATVLELHPPLPRVGEGRVEVELFTPFLEDDGVSTGDLYARDIALGAWWPSIEQARLPVSLIHRQIDEGAGLDSRYREYRRAIRELVVEGAWYAEQGDERGLELVRRAMRRHADRARPSPIAAQEIDELLTGAGFDPAGWREATREAVEEARARDHERWNALANQYLAWDGYSDRTSPLGRISQPIIVVDGRYLVSAMTVSLQGGHRGIERLFQTVNRLIRERIEERKLEKGGRTMNATAIALAATVCIGLVGCGPTQVADVGKEVSSAKGSNPGYLSSEARLRQ